MRRTLVVRMFAVGALTFIPVLASANSGDFDGGVAIGSAYAGINTTPSNGMLVQGSVGIGTTSPNSVLSVAGNGFQNLFDASFNNSGNNESFHLYSGSPSTPNVYIYAGEYDSGSGSSSYSFLGAYDSRTGASSLDLQKSGGSVGIGVAAPSYTLQVNGSVAGTSAYVNLSDKRLKKNVEPLEFGLEEVEQLQPITFEWKDPKDSGMNGKQIGFIAPYVEKIMPSMVLTLDDERETKGMKYSEIIPVLTKAIQEQQVEIQELKLKVEQLAKQNQSAPNN